LVEKKYVLPKGDQIHRAKLFFIENGQKIMEIKCSSNSKSIFYGDIVMEGIHFDLYIKIAIILF